MISHWDYSICNTSSTDGLLLWSNLLQNSHILAALVSSLMNNSGFVFLKWCHGVYSFLTSSSSLTPQTHACPRSFVGQDFHQGATEWLHVCFLHTLLAQHFWSDLQGGTNCSMRYAFGFVNFLTNTVVGQLGAELFIQHNVRGF